MRIALVNQFFWPDGAATGQLLTDLARSLAADGHEVTALCAAGSGYAPSMNNCDAPPVRICRVQALPFQRGPVGRLLSYLTFFIWTAFYGLRLPRQDIVVTLTTPPLLPLLGTLLKVVCRSRHFIWEMDVYPDVAVDLDIFKAGGLPDRITGLLADISRTHADGIIALGECMKERLIRRSVRPSQIFIAENWADGNAITPRDRPGNPEQLVLLYSGNLGLAHDLETILGSVDVLRQDKRFRFLFIGSGGRRKQLEDFIFRRGIDSVELRPYVPRESLAESLAAGDIGLVTQKEACCGSVVPSKIYGLLAAGRPILFIGPDQATPARLIRQFDCGWHINVGEVDRLTELLLHLADNRTEITQAGKRARQCLMEHFDLSSGVARISTILSGHSVLQDSSSSSPELIRASEKVA